MAETKSTAKKTTAPAAPAKPAAKEYQDTNVLAIVSLIAGIAGLTVMPFVGSIAAVITGHIGRKELHAKNQKGDGMAVAGLITGYIGVGFYALVLMGVAIMIAAGLWAVVTSGGYRY